MELNAKYTRRDMHIESMKTMSMGTVSTGVLDENKEHDTKRRNDNQLQSMKIPCRISKLSSNMWHKGVR